MTADPQNRAEIRDLCDNIRRRALSPIVRQRIKLKNAGGGKMTGCCPFHKERSPSFYVYDRAPTHYHCFGCGAHGDAVTLYMELDNVHFLDAVQMAAAAVGIIADVQGLRNKQYKMAEPAPTPEEDEAARKKERDVCRKMWNEALPAAGTIVEKYLAEIRKISIADLPGGIIPPSLRFYSDCPYWIPDNWNRGKMKLLGKFPAMIAPLQAFDRSIQGIHLTYLDPRTGEKLKREIDGRKLPSKKMRGLSWGCAIRLAEAAEFMSCGEGIENVLSGMSCGAPGGWAAGSLGNLAGRGIGTGLQHPKRLDLKLPSVYPDMTWPYFRLPEITKRVLELQDNDSKDPPAAEKLFDRSLRRIQKLGMTPFKFVPPEGMDVNAAVIAGILQPGSFNAAFA